MRGVRPTAILGLLGLTLVIELGTLRSRPPQIREALVADRPIQSASSGYVSSQTCQACHPGEYASWHRSYHRTMTQVATPATVLASFDNTQVADVYGAPMRLERRRDQLWAEFDDPDWKGTGDRAPRLRRSVVMITGSHHQQVYWYPTGKNRLLGQLPAAYILADKRWVPRRSAVLHPPNDPFFSETGHWNSTCIACHATDGRPEFDTPFGSRQIETQIVDTKAGEFGIACEACHGPSADHVRANRNPWRRYSLHLNAQPDRTSVQPARLPPRLSSQVCGQCHGVWEFYDAAGERHANSAGLPYRPGDELRTTRFVAQPTDNRDSQTLRALLADDPGFLRDSFWSDGMVRVSGREYNGLIESPCFKNAHDPSRTLSCLSCHSMHEPRSTRRSLAEWADDQLAPDMRTNRACLQCHESMSARLTEHTKHAPSSEGSSCYNCHMPFTTYGLLKTIRSHQVSSPSVEESVDAGRPNACNLCHLDKPLSWTGVQLERWYGGPTRSLETEDQRIASSLLWLLRGDAGQRAIVAQAMGWGAAQQTSGTAWMAPYLAQLLDDPYDAVRFIAVRSLRTLPGFRDFQYDFVSPRKERIDAQRRTMGAWDRVRGASLMTDRALLFRSDGKLDTDEVLRLLRARDNRRMLLRE